MAINSFLPPRILFRPLVWLWELLHRLLMACLPPDARLARQLAAFWLSDSLYVAVRLGIPDILADGVKDAHDIAEKIEGAVDEQSLLRLLRFLAANDVLTCDRNGRFGLTRSSTLLCTGPYSVSPIALTMNDRKDHRIGWSHLEEAVRTGIPGFVHGAKKTLWEFYDENLELSRRADSAFSSGLQPEMVPLMCDFDWSTIRSIVDVGGGIGSFVKELIERYPSLKNNAVVFDRQVVVGGIDPLEASAYGFLVQAGSFFDNVKPPGADAYVLKHILHDWNDLECVAILRQVKEAMRTNPIAKLLIIDIVLEGPSDPFNIYKTGMDMNMLAMCSGHERTLQEWDRLLRDAGMVRVKLHTLRTITSIIEAQVKEAT